MSKDKIIRIITHCKNKEQLYNAGKAMKLYKDNYLDMNIEEDILIYLEIETIFYRTIREFRRYNLWYYK